jgi:hypothetical protein
MSIKPLAQDYVIVGRSPRPELIMDDPALAKLPSGRLLATFTIRGTHGASAWGNPQRFNLARSDNAGRTWERLKPLEINMGLPFVHRNTVYLLGNALGRKNVIITRSDDEGVNWLPPLALFEGSFWNAPTSFAIGNGQLYRAFGMPNQDGLWNQTVVVAGDLSRDLLNPKAWRISPPVEYPGTPKGVSAEVYPLGVSSRIFPDHWLEPNVINVRGSIRVLHRCRIDGYGTSSICGVCDVIDDGMNMDYRFTQFYPMPGAQGKFHIIYDASSRLFWTPVNLPTDSQNVDWSGRLEQMGFKGRPGNERRLLMLIYSLDVLNWFQAGCIAMWSSPMRSFHYAAPLIDGDDMLILSRTTKDGRNQHDSDLVTFHRIPDFRSLALDLHAGS